MTTTTSMPPGTAKRRRPAASRSSTTFPGARCASHARGGPRPPATAQASSGHRRRQTAHPTRYQCPIVAPAPLSLVAEMETLQAEEEEAAAREAAPAPEPAHLAATGAQGSPTAKVGSLPTPTTAPGSRPVGPSLLRPGRKRGMTLPYQATIGGVRTRACNGATKLRAQTCPWERGHERGSTHSRAPLRLRRALCPPDRACWFPGRVHEWLLRCCSSRGSRHRPSQPR